MKKAPVYIILIFFLCTAGLYSAEVTDTNDTSKVPKEKAIDVIFTGGIGFGYGFKLSNHFAPISPAIGIGIELPLTKAHKFAVELYTHWWAGKTKSTDFDYNESYFKLSNNYYSQVGTSIALKLYFGKKSNNVRCSFHLGYMGVSTGLNYSGVDFGFNLHVKLNERLLVSLNPRFIFEFSDLQFKGTASPNFLMLNCSYIF
jgi:hypothetical protein